MRQLIVKRSFNSPDPAHKSTFADIRSKTYFLRS